MSGEELRRIADLRDRVTGTMTRYIEGGGEQPAPPQQSLQMFRHDGGPGPIRQGRRGRARRRMVTFRVSLLHTSSVNRIRSHRDSTPSKPVTVPLDLESEEFYQTLRDNFPDFTTDFDLCKVDGQRQVRPLQVSCPMDIRQTRALGRSCLYLRPKATQAGMQPGSGDTPSSAAMSGASRIATAAGPNLTGTEEAASTSGASRIATAAGPNLTGTEEAASTSGASRIATAAGPNLTGTEEAASTSGASRIATAAGPNLTGTEEAASTSGASRIATAAGPNLTGTEEAASTSGASRIATAAGPSLTGTEEAASTREHFGMESESSDEGEEVLHSSPADSNTEDMSTLQELLEEFQRSNVDTAHNTVVIARRRKALHSACTALSKTYFSWANVPQIKFVSEIAEDYGGPKREFFRLLMIDVQSKMGILEGKPGDLVFTYNQQALGQNKYYTAGKLTAWVLVHNGPGLRCLNKELFKMMCGQRPPLSHLDVDMFADTELSTNLAKVKSCQTEDELAAIKVEIGDWISSCGVPNIFTASLAELPQVQEQIVAHFLFHRVASMVQQFIGGSNSCGRFWTMVQRHWKVFQPVFTCTTEKLTPADLEALLTVVWSPEGSNNREREEDTIFHWQWWLIEVHEGGTDFSLEDVLVFITGADCIPPLGFEAESTVQFYDQEPGERRLPYASTCSQSLHLPRGVGDEADFKSLMDTALKGYAGFGKV